MKNSNICMLFTVMLAVTACGSEDLVDVGTNNDTGSVIDSGSDTDSDSGTDSDTDSSSDSDTDSSVDSGVDSSSDSDSIELGSRATWLSGSWLSGSWLSGSWLSGSWGVAWLPEYYQNGGIEGISIQPFLDQVADFKTLDFIQVKLTDGATYSPLHTGPHQLLESFWYDDGIDREAVASRCKIWWYLAGVIQRLMSLSLTR
jgi:hypothetical protein